MRDHQRDRDVARAEDDRVRRRAGRQGEVAGGGEGGGEEHEWTCAGATLLASTGSSTATVAALEANAVSVTVTRLATTTCAKLRQLAQQPRAARRASARARSPRSPRPSRSRRRARAARSTAACAASAARARPGRPTRQSASTVLASSAAPASTCAVAISVEPRALERIADRLADDPERGRRPGRRRAPPARRGASVRAARICSSSAARPAPASGASGRPTRQSASHTIGRKSITKGSPTAMNWRKEISTPRCARKPESCADGTVPIFVPMPPTFDA